MEAAALPVLAGVRLPVATFRQLWHRGRLDTPGAHPRGLSSLEGPLLSCSQSMEVDEAWERIARLGGLPLWRLDKNHPFRLLAYRNLRNADRRRLAEAAVDAGLAVRAKLFEASWHDDEDGGRRHALYTSRAEAETESDPELDPRIRVVRGVLATPDLDAYWGSRHGVDPLDPLMVLEAAIVCLADRNCLAVDGVFWDDDFRPECLSAPRVGLFQRTVQAVEKRPAESAAA